jgi:hypothetical protein
MSNYSVVAARANYNRIRRFDQTCGGEWLRSSSLSNAEARTFTKLIKKHQKDFGAISEGLKRKPSECMIHYYNWKRTKTYIEKKSQWKSDYCSICDDGGDLIICDLCERGYHLPCLKPPLKKIPEGDWFCPRCMELPASTRRFRMEQSAAKRGLSPGSLSVSTPGDSVSSGVKRPRGRPSKTNSLTTPNRSLFPPLDTVDEMQAPKSGSGGASPSSSSPWTPRAKRKPSMLGASQHSPTKKYRLDFSDDNLAQKDDQRKSTGTGSTKEEVQKKPPVAAKRAPNSLPYVISSAAVGLTRDSPTKKYPLDFSDDNLAQKDDQRKSTGTGSTKEEVQKKPPVPAKRVSDSPPNLISTAATVGLMKDKADSSPRPDDWIGAYSPESRKVRIDRFLEKRKHRAWTKKIEYEARKSSADSRPRIKGRFFIPPAQNTCLSSSSSTAVDDALTQSEDTSEPPLNAALCSVI